MSRWKCAGCQTVYALKLYKCQRCHGTCWEEVMAKATVHAGDSNGLPDNAETLMPVKPEVIETDQVDDQETATATEESAPISVPDIGVAPIADSPAPTPIRYGRRRYGGNT